MKALLPLALAIATATTSSAQPLDLDDRIARSLTRLTDTTLRPAFDRAFVLADVALDPDNPRRFYNFSGDLSGRYLEVMSVAGGDVGGLDLPSLAGEIIGHQQPDGRFGDPGLAFTAEQIGGEHMALLWGNGRLLVGLMAYYQQSGDEAALKSATRLGDFFIGTAEACREPGVVERLGGYGAKGIICFTQYIEGLVMLARATGEPRFERAARDAYTVLPPRGRQHAHGYLSTLRGALQLYELTGDEAVLAYVRETFDDLLDSDDHTMYGAVYEYFGGEGDDSGGAHAATRDEGCSSADFCRLALHLHEVTGEERYLEAGERSLVNALFYNQYPNGDFGHHFIEEGVFAAANPRRSWWCCTMHGLRALLEVRDRYGLVDVPGGGVRVQLFAPGTYTNGDLSAAIGEPSYDPARERYVQSVELDTCGVDLAFREPGWALDQTTTPVADDPCGRYEYAFSPALAFSPSTSRAGGELPDSTLAGYLTLGPHLLGARATDFVAEPDWANAIRLAGYGVLRDRLGLRAEFRHGGYPGLHPVELVPIATQTAAGHPYMRVVTGYGRHLRLTPVD